MCNKERIVDFLYIHLPFKFGLATAINSLSQGQVPHTSDIWSMSHLVWILYQSIKLRRATKRNIYRMPRSVNALELGCGLC
jgi:hypothetical protein